MVFNTSKNSIQNKCLLCDSVKFTELFYIEKFPIFFGAVPRNMQNKVNFYPLKIAVCDKCALVQQINLLNEDVLNEVYQAEYYNCPSPVASGMGVREIEKFYTFFQKCNLNTGKLLEIACFDGYLLTKLQKDGWDVYGCDPSTMTKIPMETLGSERIINDFFTSESFGSDNFDVIIFRNLLEHLYDIHKFIDAVSGCLKIGGHIFVDVPNVKQLLKIGGIGTFFHQHITYFSINTLSYLLSQHGFNVEQSHEGNPNLFVSAIKKMEIPIGTLKIPYHAKTEGEQYLKSDQEIKNFINKIFHKHPDSSIALFGASVLATSIITFLEAEKTSKIKYIFDNDSQKHGKLLIGCDALIQPPEQLIYAKFDVILITTYIFHEEIKEQLVKMGVGKKKIITFRN